MVEQHDIILPAAEHRVYVNDPQKWGQSPGTDYFLKCHEADMAAAGGRDLVNHGWESGGFSYLASSGADFLSGTPVADRGTLGGFNFDAANDYLISPFIFGDYAAALEFQNIMGYLPTTLVLEVYARFAANADENATGFGFLEAGGGGGSPADADMMAFIGMGATHFELIRGDGTVDASAAVFDTDPHLFKISLTGAVVTWYIDDVSQGTLVVQDDLWPCAFVINTETGGDGDPVVSWAHVHYQ